MAAANDMSSLERWVTQARTRLGVALCIRPLHADDREREIASLPSVHAWLLSPGITRHRYADFPIPDSRHRMDTAAP